MAKVTKTKKVPISSAALESVWMCEQYITKDGKIKYRFLSGYPTVAKDTEWLYYEIPSGAKIKKAYVYAKITKPRTGYSILTVNGNKLTAKSGSNTYQAKISVTSRVRTKITFAFKANGEKKALNGSSRISVTSAYLKIDYEIDTKAAKKKQKPVAEYVLPQSCCLYNPSNGKVYIFDGVVRIQHQVTTKIEQEPNTSKYDYVNNATNEPDKITLDVIMSDVHEGSSDLEDSATVSSAQTKAKDEAAKAGVLVETSRSANAFAVLRKLKESRVFLDVVTPQTVYTEMIISSIVANQDETCPYGWSGQIVLQGKYAPVRSGNGSSGQDAGDAVPTQTVIGSIFGTNTSTAISEGISSVVNSVVGVIGSLNPTTATSSSSSATSNGG